MTKTGITLYGCDDAEATLAKQAASRLGVDATITRAPLSDETIELAAGNRRISVSHKAPITRPLLRKVSKAGVRYISTRSAGQNHIDTAYAKRLGITVENVSYSPDSVADFTLMLILMTLRNAKAILSRVGEQDFRLDDRRGRELRDLTVGVIGSGRIGLAVVTRLRGFGCRVIVHDRKSLSESVPLDAMLQQSDIVSLHIPLTPETKHLLNRRRIAQMKQGALLINTARGGLIDTKALVEALLEGRLGGAALDVIEGEEEVFYTNHKNRTMKNESLRQLQKMPNVILTPHTAYYTDHALSDMVENSIANCINFKEEKQS